MKLLFEAGLTGIGLRVGLLPGGILDGLDLLVHGVEATLDAAHIVTRHVTDLIPLFLNLGQLLAGLLGLGVLDVHVTVNGEDRNLSLSGLLQGVIPTGILGGGQDDGVDFVVNELVERLNLLLLIVVLGRRVGQVKAGILECLLNVLLVGGTEAALRTDSHEANRLLAGVRAATCVAGTACGNADKRSSRSNEGNGLLPILHKYSSSSSVYFLDDLSSCLVTVRHRQPLV